MYELSISWFSGDLICFKVFSISLMVGGSPSIAAHRSNAKCVRAPVMIVTLSLYSNLYDGKWESRRCLLSVSFSMHTCASLVVGSHSLHPDMVKAKYKLLDFYNQALRQLGWTLPLPRFYDTSNLVCS